MRIWVACGPKAGMEAEYNRAWIRRAKYCLLMERTPFWQFRKLARRRRKWAATISETGAVTEIKVGTRCSYEIMS